MSFGQDHNPIADHETKQNSMADSVRNARKEIDINILFTYYEQDGNHSAVTGGTGTEELTDIASKIIVNIPLDSISKLNVNTGFSHYSSASTDRIDYRISSASSSDFHGYFNLGYTRDKPARRTSYGFVIGGAVESDYLSTSVGGQWSKISENGNQEINITADIYYDVIMPYLPVELRNNSGAVPPLDKRQTYDLSFTFSQVINRRLQAALTSEIVLQNGLLSTSFHRVYFEDSDTLKNEKLPNFRFKLPIGLRLNYFATDFLVMRLYYRYYIDNFGLQAQTANLELPIKLGPFSTIYPFYRYHTQSAAKYFKPYQQHSITEKFYTSDYDLSSLNSHYVGLGFKLAPLFGLGRFRLPWSSAPTLFQSIDFRYGNYWRSDGLHAFMVSLDLGFRIK